MKSLLTSGDFDADRTGQVLFTEILSEEDILDGREPEVFSPKVFYSYHAIQRMEECLGRQCDYGDIEDLLISNPHIISMGFRKPFAIMRDDLMLAVLCEFEIIDGEMAFHIITVIRKVEIVNGEEVEEKIALKRLSKRKVFFSLRK